MNAADLQPTLSLYSVSYWLSGNFYKLSLLAYDIIHARQIITERTQATNVWARLVKETK